MAATINPVQPLYTHPYYGIDFTVTGKVSAMKLQTLDLDPIQALILSDHRIGTQNTNFQNAVAVVSVGVGAASLPHEGGTILGGGGGLSTRNGTKYRL